MYFGLCMIWVEITSNVIIENNRKPQVNSRELYSLCSMLWDVHHVLPKNLPGDREKTSLRFEISICELTKIAYFHFWERKIFNLLFCVISVAFYIEREKSEKFWPEALISAWGSFKCRKSTTRDPRLYFPPEGNHTQDFYDLKKSIDPGRDRTREPRIQRRVW